MLPQKAADPPASTSNKLLMVPILIVPPPETFKRFLRTLKFEKIPKFVEPTFNIFELMVVGTLEPNVTTLLLSCISKRLLGPKSVVPAIESSTISNVDGVLNSTIWMVLAVYRRLLPSVRVTFGKEVP